MYKNRVQCSLFFNDDDLYENFVVPLRQHHQFAEFVVNLITQYYKNVKVRQAIDSVTPDVNQDAANDVFKQIHESLAIMDYLVQEGKDSIADGMDAIDDAMKRAEKNPNITKYYTDEGVEVLRVSGIPQSVRQQYEQQLRIEDKQQSELENASSADIQSLTDVIGDLKDSIVNIFGNGVVQQSEKSEEVQNRIPINTPLVPPSDTVDEQPVSVVSKNNPSISVSKQVKDEPPTVGDKLESSSGQSKKVGNAADSLRSLISSLG